MQKYYFMTILLCIPLIAKNKPTTRYFINYQVTDMNVNVIDGAGKKQIFIVKSGTVGKCNYTTRVAKKAFCKTINESYTISGTDLGRYAVFEFNNHTPLKKYNFYSPEQKQKALSVALKTQPQDIIDEISAQTTYLS